MNMTGADIIEITIDETKTEAYARTIARAARTTLAAAMSTVTVNVKETTMPAPFNATHAITVTHRGATTTTPVLVDEGSCYTREEWDGESPADWCLDGGILLFQGSVPICDSYQIAPIEPNTIAGYAGIVAYLKGAPGRHAVLLERDATRSRWTEAPVWIDDDGVLVYPHPTDPRRGPIAAPTDGQYKTRDSAEDHAARAHGDAQNDAACRAWRPEA